jgi:large subunit ribosomal protein L5
MIYQPRLKKIYLDEVSPKFIKEFSIKNIMQVPKISAICLSMGLGEAINNFKVIETNKQCLEKICGQKVVITHAKKAISAFKLRAGMPIGIKVTLRRDRMWEFLDRLVSIALPRVRDFKGLKSNFDKNGNLTIGIKEQIIFPEIDYKDIDKIRGLNITFLTSSSLDIHAKFILKNIGIPFK